jgi:hypothetical protein
MGKVEDMYKLILRCLLEDFQARGFGIDELDDDYGGLSLKDLKQKCLQHDQVSTSVDFDLAMKELEQSKLVDTGPTEPYDNPPNSSVVFIGLVSKREYVYLTAKGYKAAR